MENERDLRVGIIEDEALMRSVLADILGAEPCITVVHTADGAEQGREVITPGSVDVVVVDVDLGDGNGVALAVQLQKADPRLNVLLLSGHDVMDLVLSVRSQVTRPWSYLSKRTSLNRTTLVRAVVATARGQVVLDPSLMRRSKPVTDTRLAGLTESQMAVLRLVAEGFSNQAAADLLGISSRSVENHLVAIYRQLGVSTGEANPRVSAVLTYLQQSSRY
ncbi:MAG TPA: response regulator transcription factor [Cellulomonas sp.]